VSDPASPKGNNEFESGGESGTRNQGNLFIKYKNNPMAKSISKTERKIKSEYLLQDNAGGGKFHTPGKVFKGRITSSTGRRDILNTSSDYLGIKKDINSS
jgi:hypothetical protein